jgi:hypothetical protein
MSSAEYALWKDYYGEAPFEPWLHTGLVCSTIANWAGKRLKDGAAPLTPADFLPGPAEEEEPDPFEHFQQQAALFDKK